MSDRSIKDTVQILAGTFNKDIVSIVACTVDSVNQDTRTCDCTAITGDAVTDIADVQLMSEVGDGMLLLPSVNSTILVALTTRNTAFVLMYSDIDTIVMRGGQLGGLIKIDDLVKAVSAIQKDLNSIKKVFSTTWTPVPNDGGAALKAASATWAAQTITVTKREDLENTNILHG